MLSFSRCTETNWLTKKIDLEFNSFEPRRRKLAAPGIVGFCQELPTYRVVMCIAVLRLGFATCSFASSPQSAVPRRPDREHIGISCVTTHTTVIENQQGHVVRKNVWHKRQRQVIKNEPLVLP